VLLLAGQGLVSLILGWVFLVGKVGWWGCAISTTILPSAILTLAVFSTFTPKPAYQARYETSRLRGIVLAGGGITHATIYRRILPFSLVLPILTCIISAAVSRHATTVVLAMNSVITFGILGFSGLGVYKSFITKKGGAIRLRQESPYVYEKTEGDVQAMKDNASWVSSPCK
jgi:hypothetical protein